MKMSDGHKNALGAPRASFTDEDRLRLVPQNLKPPQLIRITNRDAGGTKPLISKALVGLCETTKDVRHTTRNRHQFSWLVSLTTRLSPLSMACSGTGSGNISLQCWETATLTTV